MYLAFTELDIQNTSEALLNGEIKSRCSIFQIWVKTF